MAWQKVEVENDKRNSCVVVRLPECLTDCNRGVELIFDDWPEAEDVLSSALEKVREKLLGKETYQHSQELF